MASLSTTSPNLLLDLPPELRALILEDLLTASRNKIDLGDGYSRYKLHPSILRVNKQLHAEASQVLRRQNTLVRIETPWPQAEEHVSSEGQCPILAKGARAERCDLLSMAVQIVGPDGEYDESLPCKFIVCLEDLPALCKMWMYSNLTYPQLNMALHVTINLRNPRKATSRRAAPTNPNTTTKPFGEEEEEARAALPKPTQTRLLAPFSMIKGLGDVRITGALDATIESSFRAALATPHPSPERCLELCAQLKDAGNAALKANNPGLALTHYASAFSAMHIIVDGRRRHTWADAFFAEQMRTGIFAGRDGSLVRMELRIKLVANTVLAYLKLREWDEAKFWGMRSIELMRENLGTAAGMWADEPRDAFPARDSWAKIYYRTALACKELGEMGECRYLLRVAEAWLPRDEVVKKEVAACALKLA